MRARRVFFFSAAQAPDRVDGVARAGDDEVRAPGVPGGGLGVVHRVRVRVQGGRHGRVARPHADRRRQRHQRLQRLGAAQPLPRRRRHR